MAGRPFILVPLMGTPKGYSSFNVRTSYYPTVKFQVGFTGYIHNSLDAKTPCARRGTPSPSALPRTSGDLQGIPYGVEPQPEEPRRREFNLIKFNKT